jgi:hypothetical protein
LHDIAAKDHVASVLLGAAQDQEQTIIVPQILLNIGPAQFGQQ